MPESNSHWALTPQFITSIIGVIGLITAFFWTVADFRIEIRDLDTRMDVISKSIENLDKRFIELDMGGSRKLLASDIVVKQLQDRVKELEESTHDLNRALLQHNEAMVDLYTKDMSDGKRDFKIPKTAPKFH
jgi:hypothetical protein